MTDDLAMGPIYQYGVCAAVVEALNAGVDLLLVAYDGQQFYRVFDCALTASAQGRIDETATAKSIARLNARTFQRDASARADFQGLPRRGQRVSNMSAASNLDLGCNSPDRLQNRRNISSRRAR